MTPGRMSALVSGSRFVTAFLLVNVLLLAPVWLGAGGPGSHWIALDALFVVGLFAVLPRRRWSVGLAGVTAFAVVLVSVLGLADAVTRQSLARPLNLYLDLHLVSAVNSLLTGSVGPAATAMLFAGVALGAGLSSWLLARLLSPVGDRRRGAATRTLGLAMLGACSLGLAGDGVLPLTPRAGWPALRLVRDQTRHLVRMLSERERFAGELAAVRTDYSRLPHLLHQLRDRDVLLAFVESYGVSALDDPRFARIVRPRLDDLTARLSAAGLYLASGRLVAPTQGGQSWLSHGSLLSGAWLDNQLRYDLLLASGRETLIDDFRRAGHRTVALVPAITLAWPEGERLGYDDIFARQDIDYRGPALNWVTMPDQFTWSFLERTIRTDTADGRPVFAELSLISSHAPWTPILPVLDDWDGIGDGSIFAAWAQTGERPEELWLDTDRVREHYARAVEYAINAAIGYAERYVDDRTLLIVMGDHQPAPLIIGDDASLAVPVHVISGDRQLVRHFVEWGFTAGGVPDPHRPVPRMDAFRDWFLRSFSQPAGTDAASSVAEE